MINNNVSFSGREDMLNTAVKQGQKAVSVVKASSILPEIPQAASVGSVVPKATNTVYTNPFAPIGTGKYINYLA